MPWWGAVLIALVPTAVGALIDAGGSGELSTWFRVLYFVGCVAAVLAVRRKALFTAVTQPPLVAFGVALIALYSLEADASSGIKGLIINVMLPIAKAFPHIRARDARMAMRDLPELIVPFKRKVYEEVVATFAHLAP